MKLTKRKHKLNYGAEGVPPLRRFVTFLEKKISFVIYYLIIFAFFFFVITSGWKRVAYINGNGIVEKGLVTLRADADLYLLGYPHEEGDTLTEGDTLCHWRGAHTKYYKRSGDGNKSLDRKLVTLQVSINEKRTQLQELRQARSDLNKRLTKSRNQISLELKPDEKITTLENAITANKRREVRLISDIENLKVSINDVQTLLLKKDSTELIDGDSIIEWGTYQSTWKGEIHEYVRNIGEYVKEGEEILTLTQLDSIHIDAFFKMKYIDHITVGTEVTLELPNNDKLKGKISKVFKTSEPLPAEFKKSYDISRPRIYAHIQVTDSIPLELINGMTVRVLVKRGLPWN